MASTRNKHHGDEEGSRLAQHKAVPGLLPKQVAQEVSIPSRGMVLGSYILGKPTGCFVSHRLADILTLS